jgi:hypothetical protein
MADAAAHLQVQVAPKAQLAAPQVLGDDIPVQVPREVERLRGIVDGPVRA